MTDQPMAPAVAADEPPAAPATPTPTAREHRVLRAALRWTSAVLVFAALGGATAYAVTQPERTEIPGLRTPEDGRWTYPALSLPRLPEGAPRPLEDVKKNPGRRHYADLRALLLPAPEGAKNDPVFPGRRGWLPTGTFLQLFQKDHRQELALDLKHEGLRHIAARAWTTKDGTHAAIYLLQYSTQAYATRSQLDLSRIGIFQDAPDVSYDPGFGDSGNLPDGVDSFVFDERKPRGRDHVRYAHLVAGDTIAVIVLSHRGSMPAVPTHQTVLLQAQLLS
jgi:hypothetical protein